MGKIKVYVIEDYFLARVSYVKYLESTGKYEILGHFATAEEGILAMQKTPAEVILIDLKLPKMNGIEALEHFQKNFPLSKCIVLTSLESENAFLACFSLGAKGYVTKETSIEKLDDIITSVANGAYWIDEKVEDFLSKNLSKQTSTDLESLCNKNKEIQLTPRETEILKLLVEGKNNSEIAEEIFISTNTVKAHIKSIMAKFEVKDRVQTAVKALRLNLV